MAIDWLSFSIGAGKAVQFNQPDASSVALNRVTGVEPSLILGSLTSNGQVFLVNPNGVIFGRDSMVSTGSLIATTQQITNQNFMAGRYQFSATAPGLNTAVINQGRIQTPEGGVVGLIAARVSNAGSIHTPKGQTHLVAADEVLVDFGGPVKVQVQRGTLDALVENGGAVTAPGGLVIFRADAANALSRSVINHSGVVEAQTLQAGPSGQIFLLATGSAGARTTINASGTLDASAPHGGNGGFIETSARTLNLDQALRVSTQAAQGSTGEWLIDPTNIEIVSGTGGTFSSNSSSDTQIGASTLQTQLSSSNVSIVTSATGSDAGNITVSAPVSWSANKLTLRAHNDIFINADLNASGSASLAFEFGAGRNFSFGNGVSAWIPNASAFTWKEGTGAVNPLFLNSGALRFGYNGSNTAALESFGVLMQPFYAQNSGGTVSWRQLTFSNRSLEIALGVGGAEDPNNSWTGSGVGSVASLSTSNTTGTRVNIAGYQVGKAGTANADRAWGTLVAEATHTIGTSSITASNSYTLDNGSSYLRAVTTLKNPSTTASLSNLRLWTGTGDDYVGGNDRPTKTKGNFVDSGGGNYSFQAIGSQADQAKALSIASGGETVYFYSTSSGANVSTNSCCSFSSAYNQNPKTSQITLTNDGSYAIFSKFANLAPGASDSMTWFYAAGAVSDLSAVINQVAAAAQQAEVQQAAASNVATALSLSRTTLPAVYGQSVAAPTVTSNNTVGAFTYSSSNTNVVQINATTGALSLVGPGTATITIDQAAGTGYTAGSITYTITVQAAVPSLAGLPTSSARVNFNGSLAAPTISSISPGAISYSSSNPSIARVDPVTGAVTPVGVGRVTITVSQAASGGYAAASSTYTIDVEAPALPSVVQTVQAMPQQLMAASDGARSNGVSANSITTAADAIRSAARVVPMTPAAALPTITQQAPVEQVASQLPVTSGGLALMRVASLDSTSAVPATANADSTPASADGQAARGNTAVAGPTGQAGGSDALGFMRVFVVGGGIQLPSAGTGASAASNAVAPALPPSGDAGAAATSNAVAPALPLSEPAR